MDQALKARLIGAAVLVALAVLLIPELLSGRKPAAGEGSAPATSRGTRTFTIELAGGTSAASPAPTAEPVPGVASVQASAGSTNASQASSAAGKPADPATAAGPAAAAPTTATPPPRPAPAVTESGPAPAAQPAQPAQSRAARGGWAVQVGAFSSADAAAKMADQLKSAGYNAYVTPVSRSGKTLQRVRVGPEAERARAEGLAASLKARGLPATVVAND